MHNPLDCGRRSYRSLTYSGDEACATLDLPADPEVAIGVGVGHTTRARFITVERSARPREVGAHGPGAAEMSPRGPALNGE